MRKVIVNGKFLSAGMTGVHRVALELIKNAIEIVSESPELRQTLFFEVWIPRNGLAQAKANGLPYRVVSPFVGIPWEQITLPIRARGHLVLSLCNVGPMLIRNALTMYHDAQVWSTPDSYTRPFRAWYWLHQSVAGRRHRRILTVSEYSRRQLAHYRIVSPNRVGVILNGVDHGSGIVASADMLNAFGLRTGRYVVALANVQVHKNIGMLLKAFSSPALEGIELVLFGSADRKAFEQRGYFVPQSVKFVGRIEDDVLRALYTHAACIAFPSTTEGFGLPPLEAMLLGCPAIVAPEGALPEVCGDAVCYADAHRPDLWEEAIVRMTTDSDYRNHFVSAGKTRAAQFTWRSAAMRMIEEIRALPAQ